mmetsp:Transcript_66951/g.189937  ORF Transcript_66951/g.189937 Transcript_66951/m.189937 type:complete len:348 (-) Transcript_66951:796-1839(-)
MRRRPPWMSWAIILRVRMRMPLWTLLSASATVLLWHRSTRTRDLWTRGSLPVRSRRSPSRSVSAEAPGVRLFAPSSWPCFFQGRVLRSKIWSARWSFCTRHSSRRAAPQTGMACMAAVTASLRPWAKNLSLRHRSHHASTCRMRSSCGQDHLSFSKAAACVGGRLKRSPISRNRFTIIASSGSAPSARFLSHSTSNSFSHVLSLAICKIVSESMVPRKCNFETFSRNTASACSAWSASLQTYRRFTGATSGYFATSCPRRSTGGFRSFFSPLWSECIRGRQRSSTSAPQGTQARSSPATCAVRPQRLQARQRRSRTHLAGSPCMSVSADAGSSSGNFLAICFIFSWS